MALVVADHCERHVRAVFLGGDENAFHDALFGGGDLAFQRRGRSKGAGCAGSHECSRAQQQRHFE